jgi:hypothetical protein
VDVSVLQRWADSGAMALTGLPDLPLGPPEGLVDALDALGRRFGVDGVALLGERAALMGLWRRGQTSCGGSCRLFSAPSGREWLAVSLPRDEDLDAVPAWLELDAPLPATAPALWSAVGDAVATTAEPGSLLERAELFGLPVAVVGEVTGEDRGDRDGVTRLRLGDAEPASRGAEDVLVVDLSSLWAGPLCGDLLADAGASVVKVESVTRPDGARRGPAAFFDLLNGRKRSVALDFTSRSDVGILSRLVQRADVVLEASRPRALEQLGIRAVDVVAGGGPRVWVSITGYGRQVGADGIGRVAFGDDAAAAGGLVVWLDGTPLFCADAVADPVSGLTAADACLDALAAGGRWLLDVSMASVCARFAGPTVTVPLPEQSGPAAVADPRARDAAAAAHGLGADTADVLAELGLETSA